MIFGLNKALPFIYNSKRGLTVYGTLFLIPPPPPPHLNDTPLKIAKNKVCKILTSRTLEREN